MFALPEVQVEKSILQEIEALLGQQNLKNAYLEVKKLISSIEDFETIDRNELEKNLRDIARKENVNFADLARVLRLKLCGSNKTPDIITVIYLLGEKCKKRI
jgi:hypothetical protein